MLQRNSSVLWRELSGEAVLLDPKAGCSYNLNTVGTLIWKMLDGTHTSEEIAEAICAAYEVEQAQALEDIERLLSEFMQSKLVTERIALPRYIA
jgi:hypothetical protein